MKPLFDVEGRCQLLALASCRHPLLVFDFDGTLSPIVPLSESARVPVAVLRRLRLLARIWPVAVVSGRTLVDVQERLPVEVPFVLGNRGIEGLEAPHQDWSARLDPIRQRLRARHADLHRSGIRVEDKRYSIALHYRMADDRAAAREAITQLLALPTPGVAVEPGHCVVNLVASDAPDKGDTLQRLSEMCGADAGIYVGDDRDDEAGFRKAPPGWLTVRVGGGVSTNAAFYIDGQAHVPVLLQELLNAVRWRRD